MLLNLVVSTCVVTAGLVAALNGSEGGALQGRGAVDILSERSTEHIVAAHEKRMARMGGSHHALAKRAKCPARGVQKPATTSSSTTSTKVLTVGKPVAVSTSSIKTTTTTHTTTSSKPPQNTPAPPQNNNGGSTPASGGAAAFNGNNNNAILSWFRTNAGSDSTNGRSWCQTPYRDDWVCFAPSVGTMLKAFNWNYEAAAKHFCGREAIVTDVKTGKSITAFICDGFDDRWLRTPASLDLTISAFTQIKGSFDWDKNHVITGATWHLTGNIVHKGTFKATW